MQKTMSSAAAWAAPLFAHSQAGSAKKRTQHLPALRCVLWLPERQGYLKAADLVQRNLAVSANAADALQLTDEAASDLAGNLMAATGARVHVRTYCPMH